MVAHLRYHGRRTRNRSRDVAEWAPILGHAGLVGEFAVKENSAACHPKTSDVPRQKKRPILGHAGLVGEFRCEGKSGSMHPQNF